MFTVYLLFIFLVDAIPMALLFLFTVYLLFHFRVDEVADNMPGQFWHCITECGAHAKYVPRGSAALYICYSQPAAKSVRLMQMHIQKTWNLQTYRLGTAQQLMS